MKNRMNVELLVSEFIVYAYGMDCEVRGYMICGEKLLVWNSYMRESKVHVWELTQTDFDLVVNVEVSTNVDRREMLDVQSDSELYSDPYKVYPNITTANDFVNIALIYT